MPDDPPHQPHDKLFKSCFSEPDTAAAFLKTQLSPALVAQLDWTCLKLEAGSFIDEKLKGSESDLLYRLPYRNREAFIYLLFEHQRYEDQWLAFRLLCYIVRIWKKFRKEHPEAKKLLPVIPLVLAQNATAWEVSTHLHDLVDVAEGLESEILLHTPGFEYHLMQLAQMPMDSFSGTPAGILTMRVLKAEQQNGLLTDIVWDETLHLQVSQDMLRSIFHYIYHARDVDKNAFVEKINALKSEKLQENTMTLAQQFRQEGWQKGRQEGRQEGWQEGRQEGRQEGWQEGRWEEGHQMVRRLLQRRFGELPAWTEARLSEGTLDDLNQWAERILEAVVIEDVFA